MKKFLFFIFFILITSASSVALAADDVPDVCINNVVVDDDCDFVMHSDTLYVTPKTAANLLKLTLSSDESGIVHTFSTPTRTITYDTHTGSLNVNDRRSFAHKIEDSAYPSYSQDDISYISVRMLCSSLGLNISYDSDAHAVNIIKPAYYPGFYNSDGVAIAAIGDRFGLVNITGNVLLPFEYDDISNYDNPALYKVISNHKCGLVSNKGNRLTEFIYDDISYVSPSEIYLIIDGNKGMCDVYGNIIIPVEYDDITYCANLIAMVKINSKWQLLNCITGKLSDTKYDEVYEITNGIQTDNNMIKGYYAHRNGKWGCVDSFGNTVIEFKYDALDKFDSKGRARVISGGKMGIIDCGGKIVVPTAYDYIHPFGNLNVAVAQVGDKYGAVDINGNVAVPFEYDYMYSFNDAPTTIAYKDKNFSVISTDGTKLNTKGYSYAEEFKNGMALAFDSGYGYIDHNADEIIPCIHSEVKQGTAMSVFLKKDDKWALFSPSGNNLTGYIYADAGNFENGLSSVKLDNVYGYVNDSGDTIIPFEYSTAQQFKYGKAIVSKGRNYGIIDIENDVVIPFEYSGFNPSYDYNVIAAADKSGKWGLISFANEPLTAFVYDYVFEFDAGYAAVLKDGKYGVIDTYGNVVADLIYNSAESALNTVLQ